MPVEDWQAHLRRQFGREQPFLLENIGTVPLFSEFMVSNPDSGGRYRVAIRGAVAGDNFCVCADFATTNWAPASTSSSRSLVSRPSAAARRR